MQKRFTKHKEETSRLRGNDLRYNVYLKKIQKLARFDLGLDVEAYKDYCNNLKIFAKYDKEYQILADDINPSGTGLGIFSDGFKPGSYLSDEYI